MVSQLDRPFHLPPGVDPHGFVTQGFGVNNPGVEPPGFKYPDGSIWYVPAPGAIAGSWHNGVDYGLSWGTPLFAPTDGTIVFAGWGAPLTQPIDTRGFGNCLVIRHETLGVYTLYGHLQGFEVVFNQPVSRGQPIALVDSTGNSTGSHLHWSVIRIADLHYVDPTPYVESQVQPSIHVETFHVTPVNDGDPVRVFDGPSRQFSALRILTPGVQITCTAWTYGEPRFDKVAGQNDSRWYQPSDGGWVASARVLGDAPGSTPFP